MDSFYDLHGAADALEEIAVDRKQIASSHDDSVPHLSDIEADKLTVVEMGAARKHWRMCTSTGTDGIADELVFTIQGVLLKASLVPKQVRECPQNRIIRLSQYAEIGGMGSAIFEEAMAMANVVHERVVQHFSGSTVSNWNPELGPFGTVFAANNRLFTMKMDAPAEQDTEFEPGVDPLGLLASIKPRDMIHGPDNIVKYFRKNSGDETRSRKYVQSYPGAFRVGDLVEMQASFVAILTGRKEIKVTTRLHALTLLDASFTLEAEIKRSAFRSKTVFLQKEVRRKVGYWYEDEIDGQSSKRTRMVGQEGDASMN